MLVLRFQDRKYPEQMSNRHDCKLGARSLAVIRHQEGRGNRYIPKSKRERRGRWCWTPAQDHEVRSIERSADLGERTKGCQTVEPM